MAILEQGDVGRNDLGETGLCDRSAASPELGVHPVATGLPAVDADTADRAGCRPVGELDDATRKKFSISPDVSGVVVSEVAKDSAAAERGIVAGEVITEIAQESVSTPQQVLDRIAALKEQGRKNALLMLASKSGELRFVTIRMD